MGGLVLFLLTLAVMGLFYVAASIENGLFEITVAPNVKEANGEFEFSTFTSAVCEGKNDVVHCKDEVFVNCDGNISKLDDATECNGIKLDVPKATGDAVFGKEWKDPRN